MSAVLQRRINNPFRRKINVANIPTWVPVVALALFDGNGRVLMQRRPAARHHGGYWEFPGGKVEPVEKPRNALVREIAEELGITLDPKQLSCANFAEEAGERHIVLFLYTSRQACGVPVGRDGQEWGWFTLRDAAKLALAPMDAVLLAQMDGSTG